jgi:DNA-binding PadR family transcriptional regulator
MSLRKLSTIELTVLGMTYLRQPCTIYAVMKELGASASSYYKSRAGTAYSVANRLISFGLLDQSEDQLIHLTEDGEKALKHWLTPPLPVMDIAHSADLIRLRTFFLGIVDLKTRLEFLDSAEAGFQTHLRRCEQLLEENQQVGDYFGGLATVSGIFETQARIKWIRLIREWVENPERCEGEWAERLLALTRENKTGESY